MEKRLFSQASVTEAKGQKDSRNLRNNNNKLEQKGAFIFNSFMALNFLTLVAVVWNDCVRDRIA